MNCRTFNKLLSEYLYGDISVGERESFLAHASACPQCRRLLTEMEETVSFVGDESKPRFSPGEMAALRNRVREEISRPTGVPARSPRRSGFRFFSRPLFLPVAGSVAAAAVVVLLLYHPAKGPDSAGPVPPDGANELVAMTETVEEEFDSVGELCREIDELQLLFLEEPDPGSEAEIGSDNLSAPA